MNFQKICLGLIIFGAATRLIAMVPLASEGKRALRALLADEGHLIKAALQRLEEQITPPDPFLAGKDLRAFKKILKNKIKNSSQVEYELFEIEPFKSLKGFGSKDGQIMFAVDFEKMLDRGTQYEIYRTQNLLTGEMFIARKALNLTRDIYQSQKREVEILKHLGLLVAICYSGKNLVIITNYIPGINLDKVYKILPPLLQVIVANNILLKVHDLHNKGIFHCDLKISNLLLDIEKGMPVIHIIDFSDSHFISEGATTKTGAPFMIPPELFRNAPPHNYSISFFMAAKAMAHLISEDFEQYYLKLPELCQHKEDSIECSKCSYLNLQQACKNLFDEAHPLVKIELFRSIRSMIFALCKTNPIERPEQSIVLDAIQILSVLEKDVFEELRLLPNSSKKAKKGSFKASK